MVAFCIPQYAMMRGIQNSDFPRTALGLTRESGEPAGRQDFLISSPGDWLRPPGMPQARKVGSFEWPTFVTLPVRGSGQTIKRGQRKSERIKCMPPRSSA